MTNMPFIGRADLAREVYETIFRETDTWEDIGQHIAYLLGAILTDDSFSAVDGDEERDFVRSVLLPNFPLLHPVWRFVDYET